MDDHGQEQAEEEARRLVLLVEKITGLRSRWNGQIMLMEDAAMLPPLGRRVSGETRGICGILISSMIRCGSEHCCMKFCILFL